MISRVAREYEGKISFLTSPGQDGPEAMQRFVKEYGWPDSMTHAVDKNGELWQHFRVRYRGAWIFLNDDGKVLYQSPSHIRESDLRQRLDELVEN